ncbi:MAG: hypothetical protein HC920_21155 [Oscillatoriales cyanobacterium SM2_3_0]|nr:hypothetical protein [Oscillatoriales cyanobacterium SM2_3_0]
MNTQRLSLSNGSQVESVISGAGIGGAVTIQADEIAAFGALRIVQVGSERMYFLGRPGEPGTSASRLEP